MAILVGRTVRYWTFPPAETAKIRDALVAYPEGSLRIIPDEDAKGEPQIRWKVIAGGVTTQDNGTPGGNNSTICPPACG